MTDPLFGKYVHDDQDHTQNEKKTTTVTQTTLHLFVCFFLFFLFFLSVF